MRGPLEVGSTKAIELNIINSAAMPTMKGRCHRHNLISVHLISALILQSFVRPCCAFLQGLKQGWPESATRGTRGCQMGRGRRVWRVRTCVDASCEVEEGESPS